MIKIQNFGELKGSTKLLWKYKVTEIKLPKIHLTGFVKLVLLFIAFIG
jgi:hypothetical protein